MNPIKLKRDLFPKRADRKSIVYENVLFIDPGLEGTGFAFFEWLDTMPSAKKKIAKPAASGAYRPKRTSGAMWQSDVAELCQWFAGLLRGFSVRDVVLEFQEVWIASSKSSAAAVKGDLQKLTYLTGALGATARAVTRDEPTLVLPREWKGQLPKDVVTDRVKKILSMDVSNHEGDAVGMGLAAQGIL